MAWPKGVKRGPRNPAAAPVREPVQTAIQSPVQEAMHEPIREGAVQVRGRDGELLTRKRTQTSDIYFIPVEIIPQGYVYQWNVMEVVGQPQVAQRLAMQENGWRPVPCGRHPGRFMPNGTDPNSPIIRDGLVLEERPVELEREARAEEAQKARALVRDQQEQLGLTQKLPDGFSRDNQRLRAMERAGTSRTLAPAPDAPRPRLEIDPTN